MSQEKDKDKQPDNTSKEANRRNVKGTNEKAGENEKMAVIEKELKEMQKLQRKKVLTREQLRTAMIKESIKNNYEALERLSRT
ncbi:hypothetical protein MOB66_02220 [Bacillus haynesii]|uniref:hypothetical protein n=1 Tax=Bacillus TaxID=1386 RepID=UPI00224324AF|nr:MULTISPECIES: hypothetical protein [Bacillus]MCY8011267.1 hypothetical protein [Bacillus haynesii]MCY8383188.1 hypothetical protein [Bacillus haynesii]MCY9225722.1 hypothetical protein [Bacillus haynesii]MED5050140.1 hypothetical protein [Bacillus siamensis]UZN54085.1 hypothetical protein OPU65_19420 [Bacillus paralicheniformis]